MTKDYDKWFESEFVKALNEIDMKSSPGLCSFRNLGPTNADIFKSVDGVLDPERVQLVKATVRCRLDKLISGQREADNINVFVKNEAHKQQKLIDGRVRLISAVSLTDTLIDRILFGWLQRRALQVVGKTPCMVGWTPLRGGWRYIYHAYRGESVVCLDKSSWDWTVQEYMVRLWLDFVRELAVGAAPWWHEAVIARFSLLFDEAVFQFKDGTVVEQGSPGIMKSGCFLTLLLNSVSQSFLHYLAMDRMGYKLAYRQPRSIGDDTVQRAFEDSDDLERYVKTLEHLGAFVKGFKVQNWVEFCGFAFANETCFPVYWKKHLFNLLHGVLADKIESYQLIYANDEEMFAFLQSVALKLDPELAMPRRVAKEVMNG